MQDYKIIDENVALITMSTNNIYNVSTKTGLHLWKWELPHHLGGSGKSESLLSPQNIKCCDLNFSQVDSDKYLYYFPGNRIVNDFAKTMMFSEQKSANDGDEFAELLLDVASALDSPCANMSEMDLKDFIDMNSMISLGEQSKLSLNVKVFTTSCTNDVSYNLSSNLHADSIHEEKESSSKILFNKYETQPTSVLRANIQSRMIKEKSIRYNTTGSYDDKYGVEPNTNEVIYCVAAILQAEVIAGMHSTDRICPEFEISPDLPAHLFPDHNEYARNGEMLVPRASFEFMVNFINYVFTHVNYQPECNIVALVYVNRITSNGAVVLTPSNWLNVWITAIMIAHKMWEDNAYKTSSFATLLPGVSKQAVRDMEFKFLDMIDFHITISSSLYAKYYFELRQMYKDLGLGAGAFTDRPLSNVKERQLEERSRSRRPVRKSDVTHSTMAKGSSSCKSSPDAMDIHCDLTRVKDKSKKATLAVPVRVPLAVNASCYQPPDRKREMPPQDSNISSALSSSYPPLSSYSVSTNQSPSNASTHVHVQKIARCGSATNLGTLAL